MNLGSSVMRQVYDFFLYGSLFCLVTPPCTVTWVTVQETETEMWLKKTAAEKGFVEIHLVSGNTLESGFMYCQDLTLFS